MLIACVKPYSYHKEVMQKQNFFIIQNQRKQKI